MPRVICWIVSAPGYITQQHTCQELASLASHYREKPQNTSKKPRQVQVRPSPEGSTSSPGRAGLQELSATGKHLPTFVEPSPCEFPQHRRRLISAAAQDHEFTSDRTWEGISCPLSICLALPDSSTCAYTQPHSHSKASLAQQYLPWAELEKQQLPC